MSPNPNATRVWDIKNHCYIYADVYVNVYIQIYANIRAYIYTLEKVDRISMIFRLGYIPYFPLDGTQLFSGIRSQIKELDRFENFFAYIYTPNVYI